ncbi:MAG: hypothetical protein JSW20_01335 [Nitrospiraceae bacterium]|nr:MAG: hypothetical protein JSW20_01335 [Nitrospiraceae bacterium]
MLKHIFRLIPYIHARVIVPYTEIIAENSQFVQGYIPIELEPDVFLYSLEILYEINALITCCT